MGSGREGKERKKERTKRFTTIEKEPGKKFIIWQ